MVGNRNPNNNVIPIAITNGISTDINHTLIAFPKVVLCRDIITTSCKIHPMHNRGLRSQFISAVTNTSPKEDFLPLTFLTPIRKKIVSKTKKINSKTIIATLAPVTHTQILSRKPIFLSSDKVIYI